ncbi:MAG: 3-oxoacyl-[acyl-carrier-protein] synthase [Nocardioidaceae bacterium]|nr:3-oxoacyl-[acyl-carrier-protein] synthase [Nocardioidaceae bacterium]
MVTAAHASAVAVLGAGVKTAAGNTVQDLWTALSQGRSTTEVFEDDRFPDGVSTLVCRDHDFDAGAYLSPVERRRLDRSQALALAAGQDALDHCRELPPPDRRAVVCGVGLPAAATYEEQLTHLLAGGLRSLSPLTIPTVMPSSVSSMLAIRHDFRGTSVTISAACASGAAAIASGVQLLRADAADLVLAGGVDSLITFGALAGFMKLDALSRCVDRPELASRPFDVDRDGFVMGEGAGFVVLVRLADAVGEPCLGTVLGHASTSDAYHLVAPAPDGEGALRCMELALADADLCPNDIEHVNAHGTSTVLNDRAEAEALTRLFASSCPPVTSVKGTTGHMIAGSGAVEAVVALTSIERGVVPPVTGLRTLDPAVRVDVVDGEPRQVSSGPALSNSFGFGGANTVLVLGPA